MHITSLQEYGLRCLIQLARGGTEGPVAVTEISEREGLSYAYAEKLLRHLKKQGLVESARGIYGGYGLTRDPGKITMYEVLIALGGQSFGSDFCEKYVGGMDQCTHLANCGIRSVWGFVGRQIYDTLKDIHLTDLLGEEKKVKKALIQLEAERVA